MLSFLYHHALLPVFGFLIEVIPWWGWVIIIGALVGAFWRWAVVFYKTFGWQGVLGVAVALLTLGAYRQGWLDHKASVATGVRKDDPMLNLNKKKPKKSAQRSGNLDDWLKDVFNRDGK